jgi:hypothetical protein
MTRRTVGILVFPEVEVLDFCGPFEVFSPSSRVGRMAISRYIRPAAPRWTGIASD